MKNSPKALMLTSIVMLACVFPLTNLLADEEDSVFQEYAIGNGLTYTTQEVSVWRERARSGPYRVKGDAQTNSPGDYQRIKANSDSFLANPSGDRWNGGYQGGGCVPKGTSAEIMGYEPKPKGDKLKDAAFIYLLTENQTLGRVVIDELMRYVKHPLIDFSNRSRWCWGSSSVRDVNPGFFTAEWVTKMLYAYDYVRSIVTAYEKTEIEKWLLNAGVYFQRVNDDPTTELYLDREKGVLKNPTYWSETLVKSHHNGYDIPRLASHYNNRRASMARMIGQVGVLLNNTVLKNSAKQFYKDWFKFAIFPDGMLSEYFRGDVASPEKGYHYSVISLTLMLETADVFARSGDTSLYDFVTEEGIGMTKGGRKDLHLALTRIGNQLDGTTKRYFPGFPGQEAYRLDGIDPTGRQFIYDIWFASANVYFRDPYINSIYLRKRAGTLPYPTNPANVGYSHPWSSTHGTSPGLLFMHGQEEGKVWPFPSIPQDNQTTSTAIVVKARGYVAGEVLPLMRVYVNKKWIGQVYAGATAQDYRFNVKLPTESISQVTVHYVNDAVVAGVDRNLYVEEVRIGSLPRIVPSATTATYDRGALDGQDVIPGRQMMPWSGYLIVKKP